MLSKLEIKRQVFHLLAGLIFVALIYFDILNSLITGIVIIVAFAVSFIGKRYKVPIIYNLLKQLDRPKDLRTLPGKGSIFYLVGVYIVLLLFEKDVAMACIMILAIGDSIGPLIGQYGSIKHPTSKKKFLEGVIAGMIVAGLGAALFVSPLEASLAAVSAMIAEGINLKIGSHTFDDNIIMPLVAGVVIWMIRYLA